MAMAMFDDRSSYPPRDIFGEQISVFVGRGVDDTNARHYVRTIGKFLAAGSIYADAIAQVRATRAEAMAAYNAGDMAAYEAAMKRYRDGKARQPFAILQGVNPARKDTTFELYSRVMCLDIDAPKPGETHNAHITDWEQVKAEISQSPYVAYCGLSAGGAGVFVLIPIADPRRHREYFDALCDDYAERGLIVDGATGNPARLRFMSYDPAPYVNRMAWVWDKLPTKRSGGASAWRSTSAWCSSTTAGALTDIDRERVMWCVAWCRDNAPMVADSYDDWFKLAAFVAHNWDNEQGRALVHELASLSHKYNPHETERKIDSIKETAHPITLHGFYRIVSEHGCPVPTDWHQVQQVRSAFAPTRSAFTSTPTRSAFTPTFDYATRRHNAATAHFKAPSSASTAPEIQPASPAIISAAERQEMARRAADIAAGMAIVARWRETAPGGAVFIDGLDLDFAGIDDWTMTPGQVAAVASQSTHV